MKQWETLAAVERNPEKVNGAWVFAGTRVPVAALFENVRAGATIDEFLEWFPGVQRSQVEDVLNYKFFVGLSDENNYVMQRKATK